MVTGSYINEMKDMTAELDPTTRSVSEWECRYRETTILTVNLHQLAQTPYAPGLIAEARRFYQNTNLFDLVSIQPLLGEVGAFHYMEMRTSPDGSAIDLYLGDTRVSATIEVGLDGVGLENGIISDMLVESQAHGSPTWCDDRSPTGVYWECYGQANVIHYRIIRGAGNRLIISPADRVMMEGVPGWIPANHSSINELPVVKIGTVPGFIVFISPVVPAHHILVVYCGDTLLDRGYVLMPHIHKIPLSEDGRFGMSLVRRVVNSNHWRVVAF